MKAFLVIMKSGAQFTIICEDCKESRTYMGGAPVGLEYSFTGCVNYEPFHLDAHEVAAILLKKGGSLC